MTTGPSLEVLKTSTAAGLPKASCGMIGPCCWGDCGAASLPSKVPLPVRLMALPTCCCEAAAAGLPAAPEDCVGCCKAAPASRSKLTSTEPESSLAVPSASAGCTCSKGAAESPCCDPDPGAPSCAPAVGARSPTGAPAAVCAAVCAPAAGSSAPRLATRGWLLLAASVGNSAVWTGGEFPRAVAWEADSRANVASSHLTLQQGV